MDGPDGGVRPGGGRMGGRIAGGGGRGAGISFVFGHALVELAGGADDDGVFDKFDEIGAGPGRWAAPGAAGSAGDLALGTSRWERARSLAWRRA